MNKALYSINLAFFLMVTIIVASNYLVQFPINDWLTWGAFPYPISLLITELTNRLHGPKKARHVAYVGFAIAALMSIWLATPKIAFASSTAFLTSQLLDISTFTRLRQKTWWQAPFVASVLASITDTALFWTLAFWGEEAPVLTWALGDFSVKLLLDLAMLIPFRLALYNVNFSSFNHVKAPAIEG